MDFLEVTMKAVVIFDDFELMANEAARMGLLPPPGEVAPEGSMKWKTTTYELATLKQATAAELVLSETAEADLVVLALNKTRFFPPWMVDWLESWAGRRWFEGPVFVVCGRVCVCGFSPAAARVLHKFVKRHELAATVMTDDSLTASRRKSTVAKPNKNGSTNRFRGSRCRPPDLKAGHQ